MPIKPGREAELDVLSPKLFVALVFLLGAMTLDSQVVRSPGSTAIAHKKANLQDLPALDLAHEWSRRGKYNNAADSIRADAYRGISPLPLYNSKNGKFVAIHVSVNRFQAPEPLPTKSATLIVIGTVSQAQPLLASDGTMVFTKYVFTPERFLKGSEISTDSPFTVDRVGGIVLLPDGKSHFVGDTALGLPVPDHEYLMFLANTKAPNVYEIVTGYAINGGVLSSLDEFDDKMDGKSLADVVQQIRASK